MIEPLAQRRIVVASVQIPPQRRHRHKRYYRDKADQPKPMPNLHDQTPPHAALTQQILWTDTCNRRIARVRQQHLHVDWTTVSSQYREVSGSPSPGLRGADPDDLHENASS
jgi:hypothetical protein